MVSTFELTKLSVISVMSVKPFGDGCLRRPEDGGHGVQIGLDALPVRQCALRQNLCPHGVRSCGKADRAAKVGAIIPSIFFRTCDTIEVKGFHRIGVMVSSQSRA